MSTFQSKQLTAFYRSYAIWLTAGAPPYQPFSRALGLCGNTGYYCPGQPLYDDLCAEMKAQFSAAKLNPIYPFNDAQTHTAAADDYILESALDQAYLNLKRRAWVLQHCAPGWTLSFEYGAWQAQHEDFDASCLGEEDGWQGNGLSTSAPTLASLLAEIDNIAAEKGL